MSVKRILEAAFAMDNLPTDNLRQIIAGTKYEEALDAVTSDRKRATMDVNLKIASKTPNAFSNPEEVMFHIPFAQPSYQFQDANSEYLNDEVFQRGNERCSPKSGGRKSPNSRLIHNRNEKNRRADLRKSLDRLRSTLPGSDSSRATTAEILKQANSEITKQKEAMFVSLDARQMIFTNILSLLSDISEICTKNYHLVKKESAKGLLMCKKFINVHPFIDVDCFYDYRYSSSYFDNIDFSKLAYKKKYYLVTAAVSLLPVRSMLNNSKEINSSIFCSGKCKSDLRNTLTGKCYHCYELLKNNSYSTVSVVRSTEEDQNNFNHTTCKQQINEMYPVVGNTVRSNSQRLTMPSIIKYNDQLSIQSYKISNTFVEPEDY